MNLGKHNKIYEKHIPNSIGTKLVFIDNIFTLPTKILAGSNSIKELFEWVFEQEKQTNEIINKHFNKKLKMAIEDEENYQNSQDCWIKK